jgi:hypothetical protein
VFDAPEKARAQPLYGFTEFDVDQAFCELAKQNPQFESSKV